MADSLTIATENYIATFCYSMCKKLMSVQRLRGLLSDQIRNSRDSLCKRVTNIIFHKSTYIFRLYNQQAGKPCSQRYGVGNGRKRCNTASDRTGQDWKHLFQKSVTSTVEKLALATVLLINSSCTVCSGTFSTLTVKGLPASANGCRVDLENVIKFCVQACASDVSEKLSS